MRDALIGAAAAVLGFVVGLQLRVLAFRLAVPSGSPDRTHCPSCVQPLIARRMVVPGWLRPDGRCPRCATRIGPPYALVELLTAVVFGLLAWRFGADPRLPALLVGAAAGVALAVIDIAVHRLPDRLTLWSLPVVGALIVTASLVAGDGGSLVRAVLGLVVYAGLFAVLALLPPGLGFGDVKLAGLLGLVLAWIGWYTLVRGAFLAMVLAGVFALVLLFTRRAGRGSLIPLGPFMVAGALVALLASAPAIG